ncbi:MAG TPA: glutamine synthetase family protein, partial [Jatrophihabitans sp.]|nr:glutamine synthetase family protein [Jatrophihabitans sp.]
MTESATPDVLPVLPEADVAEVVDELAKAGATMLVGAVVDMAGVARAKGVPIHRSATFHKTGMGASPTWNLFCIDNAVLVTDRLSVVGDVRLRADLTAARALGEGFAWAPAEMFDQHGQAWPGCARGRLRHVQAALAAAGLDALIGHELEFVVTAGDGAPLAATRWQAYGLGAMFGAEAFVADLESALGNAGLAVEQLHAEYASYQFEVSLAPATPIEAADSALLARLVISRVARRHGLLASFSPLPMAGGAGNGAHQHLSLSRAGVPLLSGGDGPHGLTAEGAAALAGIVRGLPQTLAVFAGSVLSSSRLQPGHWSGAYACWGLENREAAVRFCAATPGNPHGANVELKCIDPSANPYLTSAMMLGLAMHGLTERAELPPEVSVDPARLDAPAAAAAEVVRLADNQAEALDLLRNSALAEDVLGIDIVDALLAVRTHEVDNYADRSIEELTERFRFA